MLKKFPILILAVVLGACSSGRIITETNPFQLTVNQIDNIFNDSSFQHAHWGALIKSLKTGEVWYSRNAEKMFMPASNQKIVTTSSAILTLGPDFQFTTELTHNGVITDSSITGDLIITGDGDPTIYTRFFDDPRDVFRGWADSLISMGIVEIDGNIVGDDNNFDDNHLGNGWSFDYLDAWYAAPVGALQFNENYIDLYILPGNNPGDDAIITPNVQTDFVSIINEVITTDTGRTRIRYNRPHGINEITVSGSINTNRDTVEISPAIFNPTLFYVTVLEEVLREKGINVKGSAKDIDDLDSLNYSDSLKIHLITHKSPSLGDIVKVLMKKSQNLYAETMVRVMGYLNHGLGSFSNGREDVYARLEEMGIDKNDISYADGSGLTRYDFVSPEELALIMEYMYRTDYKDLWQDILPHAGIDGTLKNRMKHTAAEGNVKAKTGTISNVRGLSGYVTTLDGEELVFSFLVNGHLLTSRDTETITDSVLEILANYKSK